MVPALATKLQGSLLFHLNLNYSSIEVASRREVVARCYRPLLELAERLPWLTLTLEATGHTLERIERLDPDWIDRLRALIARGRVEFVGSGDTQLIGPLVPASVNRWNQALGRGTYERLLGIAPRVALVNEMAWSQGLVDSYLDAGYEAVVTEWNNPRRYHPEWDEEARYRAVWTESPTGRRIRLLWADALLFQGLQRAVHGEREPEEHAEKVLAHAGDQHRHVFVYANDAEVFDYRPGRYASEPKLGAASEWERLARVLECLHERGLEFTTPTHVLADARFAPQEVLALNDAANPIPVKKQPKYNVTRWGLSGRDDVGLNATCFRRAKELERHGGSSGDWRTLCRAFGSDLRTHVTEKRWERLVHALPKSKPRGLSDSAFLEAPLRTTRVERRGALLELETDGVRAVLNLRRGLALESLVLKSAGAAPLIGTLPYGHFDDIDWTADFYSGHTVLEIPAEKRVTDLEVVEPEVREELHCLVVRAEVPTALGPLPKEVRVYAQRVELRYGFSRWGARPRGSLRTGSLTLLDGGLGRELALTVAQGGPRERLAVRGEVDHGRAVSSLVSASAALGATDGWLALDDGRLGFELTWPQDEAAALPLFTHQTVAGKRFARLVFSLGELDETFRPGAPLSDFRLSLRPSRIRP